MPRCCHMIRETYTARLEYHGGRKTREKTRVGQSEEFQTFNSNRTNYSGHTKGFNEVTDTATIHEGNYSHFPRRKSKDILRKYSLGTTVTQVDMESRVTRGTDTCWGWGRSTGSQMSVRIPVLPLPHGQKKGESSLSCR